MGERQIDFILCVFILLYYALILPTASTATLPVAVTGFAGSASCSPEATPEQTPTPCKQIIAFCSQPIPLQKAEPTPQLIPPTTAAILPAVLTAERTLWSGIALTPCRVTSRIPANSAAMKVAFLPFGPSNPNISGILSAKALPGVIIAIRPNKGMNFFTIRNFAKLATFLPPYLTAFLNLSLLRSF